MKRQGDYIVVAASNDQYCDSLLRMLSSAGDIRFPLTIFDLGLSEESRRRIKLACNNDCRILDPGWCVTIPNQDQLPSYKKVFLAKPFIPELVPGYLKYLWIDADIWFQDSSALDDYFEATGSDGIAISYEDHPMYKQVRGSAVLQRLGLQKRSYKVRRLEQYFGREAARKWGSGPTLNSGIFCITANSPVWHHWQHMIRTADLGGHEKKRLICDQTCLDLAIQVQGMSTPKMPATHNWCLGLADPLIDRKTRQLLDPAPPHSPIKVLHATGTGKKKLESLIQNRT